MSGFLEDALQRALGASIRVDQSTPVSGGCLHEARQLRTSAGRFFAKWSEVGPADIFLREAEGLNALRALATEIVIPRVIAASAPAGGHPAFLVLEYLAPASPVALRDEERLGRGLALIHRAHQPAHFGFPTASYCGLTRQDNRPRHSWPEFYREQRLRPLVEVLRQRGLLSAADLRSCERLMAVLGELTPQDSEPSLIHGDLWSGNVVWTSEGPALVDPACAYAEREMEFGITTLFGGLSERAFSAYQEVWPLPSEWRERNPLYQIYHLLNHAALFGGSYLHDALGIVRHYVA